MKITDAMQQFVSGISEVEFHDYCSRLSQQWYQHEAGSHSSNLSLLYPELRRRRPELSVEAALDTLIGEGSQLDNCFLEGLDFGGQTQERFTRNFVNATLIECDLSQLDLSGISFRDASMASCSMASSSLRSSTFDRAVFEDADLTNASLNDADFTRVRPVVSIRIGDSRLIGDEALGAMHSLGALVPDVSDIFKLMHHPLFEITQKICRRILEGGPSQVLGLTQRGVSARDTRGATEFVQWLLSIGFVREDRAGAEQVVEVTRDGRGPMRAFLEQTAVPTHFRTFFEQRRGQIP